MDLNGTSGLPSAVGGMETLRFIDKDIGMSDLRVMVTGRSEKPLDG